VIFVPTPQEVVDKMLEVVEVKKKDVLFSLGCGDGRFMVTAAKKYGCRAVGFEIDPRRVKDSKANIERNKLEKLAFVRQRDIFKLDLSEATVVTLYLLPSLNAKLIPQLKKLKKGSRIVSHDFDMKGVTPDKGYPLDINVNGRDHAVYRWTTPLNEK
jgi:ribosomal protein L11 methylase PrmA